jgi:hypothetical protein
MMTLACEAAPRSPGLFVLMAAQVAGTPARWALHALLSLLFAGIADHLEFRDRQIVWGRGVTSLIIVVAGFLRNGPAYSDHVAHVKRNVLALHFP